MKLTFPQMGNTFITAKALFDDLGVDYTIPPMNNKRTLELGTKHTPEMACLPLKLNIGNHLQAVELGADTIFITGGCGPCRFGYYCEMNREILRDLGHEMDVLTLEWPDQGLKEFIRRIRKLAGGLNVVKLARAVKNATQVARMVDELERSTYRIRPREKDKGAVEQIYETFLREVVKKKGSRQIKELIRNTEFSLNKVTIDQRIKPLRVGIVGEIYTSIDPFANQQLLSKLGNMGVQVDRAVTISQWIVEHMLKKALHLPRDMRYARVSKPYLKTMIGGHAQETIGHTIIYAKEGYDGVIQIFPLTCMPEIVAESILPAVERDFDIPVLTLILDEMTGDAGYMTRIEAFIDLLEKRREERGEELLFGY